MPISKFSPEEIRKMEGQLRIMESKLTNEKDRIKREGLKKEILALKTKVTGRSY